jgi:hypothetical protein
LQEWEFCYVLNSDLDPDVRRHAERHCKLHDWVINRVGASKLVAGLFDRVKALLFLNLFDAEIDHSGDRPQLRGGEPASERGWLGSSRQGC